MFNIPNQITQGDNINWSQTLDDYKPADGTLKCFIRGTTKLDLVGVPHFNQWNFFATSSQTQTLKPGKYKTQFAFFELSGEKNTLGGTELLVCLSFEKLTELETRSVDEIELEAITQAISRHSNGVKEYWIGDRKMEYRDLNELYQRQAYLRHRIAMRKNPSAIGGRNVPIRFSN